MLWGVQSKQEVHQDAEIRYYKLRCGKPTKGRGEGQESNAILLHLFSAGSPSFPQKSKCPFSQASQIFQKNEFCPVHLSQTAKVFPPGETLLQLRKFTTRLVNYLRAMCRNIHWPSYLTVIWNQR